MLHLLSFPALAHRNFRLYFVGQGISVLGSWIQQVAVAWLVYCLTGSPVWLGVVGFAGQIPSLFVAPFAGVLIDRANRHRLVILTQTLAMLLAFALAVLTFTGSVTVGHLLILSLLSGIVDAFDIPARQFLLTEMVGNGADLGNAIALNSAIFNAARLVGPALAGALLACTSAGICFLANGISFVAVIAALLAMRLPPFRLPTSPHRLLSGIGEGFTYAWRCTPIRAVLLLSGLVSMAATAASILLPILAAALPGDGASNLGFLTAAMGAGALVGTLVLAARKSVVGLGRWIGTTPVLFGLGLIGFSMAHSLYASVLLLGVAGFGLLLIMAASNTVLQTLVDEDKRGRVMSLFTMAVTGLAPIGGLLGGVLANHAGVAAALQLGGVICLVGSAIYSLQYQNLRAHIVPIYRRKGLIPDPRPQTFARQRVTTRVSAPLVSAGR